LTKIEELRESENSEIKQMTREEGIEFLEEHNEKREEALRYLKKYNEELTEKTELPDIEQKEEQDPIATLKGMIGELEKFDGVVEKNPHFLDYEQYDLLVKTGKQLTRKLEENPHLLDIEQYNLLMNTGKQLIQNLEAMDQSDFPKQDSEMESRGLLPWVEVHKCYPSVWNEPIETITELEHLIQEEFPEILTRDDSSILMDDAQTHFRLLKEVESKPTTTTIEEHAERLNIEPRKAIDWVIYNEWPTVYSLIESKLLESKSNSTISRIKSSLEEFEQGAGER